MTRKISIGRFIILSKKYPIIDVRTNAEFKDGHIPSAFNIPLFDDIQRAKVGTLYKQRGKQQAILCGLDYVGPKMRWLIEETLSVIKDYNRKTNRNFNRKTNKHPTVLIYCWRGGMRSGSLAWLLDLYGIRCFTLDSGYKAYRNHVLNSFSIAKKIVILAGYTGSGKTWVLKRISEMSEQVIDLEALAMHKGSAFGHLGNIGKKVSQEQFENNLAKKWRLLDAHRVVYLEDESRMIGKIALPKELWQQMQMAPRLFLSIPLHSRAKYLAHEYGRFENKNLKEAILKIEKRLGGQRTKKALDLLDENNMQLVAELILQYYDRSYQYCLEKKSESKIMQLEMIEITEIQIDEICQKIIKMSKPLFNNSD